MLDYFKSISGLRQFVTQSSRTLHFDFARTAIFSRLAFIAVGRSASDKPT